MKKRLSIILLFALVFDMILNIGFGNNLYGQESDIVKVGYYDIPGFQYENEDGEIRGYNFDLLRHIGMESKIQFEYYKYDNFADACSALEQKEIDLLAPVMKTPELSGKFKFSEISLETEYIVLFTNADNDELYYEDYEGFDGLKVGVVKDYPTEGYFLDYMEENEFTMNMVQYDNNKIMLEALSNGEVDCAVAAATMIEDGKVLARFSPEPYYYITWKENTDLMPKIDKALKNMKNNYPQLLEDMYDSYFGEKFEQYYSKEDLEFVDNIGTLRVAYVPGRKPLCFKNTETGQLDGISRPIFDKISEISGIKFEYVELPYGDVTYQYLVDNEIDLITGVEYNSANMQAKGVYLSSIYLDSRKVLVAQNETLFNKDEKFTVGVTTGSQTMEKVLKGKYPKAQIVVYDNIEDTFEAVKSGEVQFALHNQYIVDYILSNPKYEGLKVVHTENIPDKQCFSAVYDIYGQGGRSKEDAARLISVINIALSKMSDGEVSAIIMAETIENGYEYSFIDIIYKYRGIVQAVLVSAVVLIVSIVYIAHLKRKDNKRRQKEEERMILQQKRYQLVIDNSDDMIYEISMSGEACVLSDKIREKFGWDIPKQVENFTVEKFIEIFHIHPEDAKMFEKTTLGVAKDAMSSDIIVRMRRQDGVYIWCRITRLPLLDKENKLVSIVGRIEDVDSEIREKEFLKIQSQTDRLTGLLIKQIFEEEVSNYLDNNMAYSSCFVFVDMDHFKEINDKLGHSMGDEAIVETADRLREIFKEFDFITRFGGDEFCAFAKNMPKDKAESIAKEALNKLTATYYNENDKVTITASVGVVYSDKKKLSYEEMFKMADQSMYEAKENGRNTYVFKVL